MRTSEDTVDERYGQGLGNENGTGKKDDGRKKTMAKYHP